MPRFRNGVRVSHPKGKKKKQKYLRVSAGPQRGMYVHDLIAAAKLGRPLEDDETGEHVDGNGLNVDPDNIIVVTRAVNTHLRHMRERRERNRKIGQEEIPWQNQF